MNTTTQPQQEPAQITVADLASLQSVLDFAAQRGAFRGADMTAIGALYDKLAAFVKYAQEQAEQQIADQQGTDENNQNNPEEQTTEGTDQWAS